MARFNKTRSLRDLSRVEPPREQTAHKNLERLSFLLLPAAAVLAATVLTNSTVPTMSTPAKADVSPIV